MASAALCCAQDEWPLKASDVDKPNEALLFKLTRTETTRPWDPVPSFSPGGNCLNCVQQTSVIAYYVFILGKLCSHVDLTEQQMNFNHRAAFACEQHTKKLRNFTSRLPIKQGQGSTREIAD